MSDKTCGNCNGTCVRIPTPWNIDDACQDWQPIPVATTDAPMKLKQYNQTINHEARKSFKVYEWDDGEWVKAKEAFHELAKRDDLIRWMAEWMEKADNETQFWMKGKPNNLGDYRNLISEANELLGDVTNK